MQNDWGMAIAMGLLGLACMWPACSAVRALATGRLYVKLRYRPGRWHSRKTTPFGFWLGIAGCFAFGLFGVFCLVVSGLAVHRAMMM